MAETLLQVQGVSKSFAGKTTLMKLLTGADDVGEGEFLLDGEPYEPTSPKFGLMPDLMVARNIFIGREPRGSRLFLYE
jgi:ribose transport system ATP-binding protein